MTICWREHQVYARSGRLKPVKNKYRVQIGALADHCESCGVTDELLCWHPDIDDMTICIREADFYHRNGRLRPQRHVPKWEMAKQCESCGVTDEPLCRHPDGSPQMIICVREWQHYRRHSVLCPERVRAQWALADHCESCGATDVQLVRHPDDSRQMTVCRREYNYYRAHGILKPEPSRRRLWKMADRCESCGEAGIPLCRHPDDSLRMTICRREYDYYQLYGHLKPGRN